MKFNFLFAWYDLWIGFFWDQKKCALYFLPIPCCGVVFSFPKAAALNQALQQNDIKPLLPFIDPANFSAATIILNSDSTSKKLSLKELMG